MGCTRRHFLLSTCFLQLISIIERQVFDFLGYMWAPILINFFHIIFVIFGFYGAYHFRVKYIITYLIWNFIWIGWNTFLICFYLDIGVLDKNSDILNLGTGSVSWFEVNGYGCKPVYPINITSEDPYRPVRPEMVNDCLLDYPIIEIIHSGIQCILAVFAIIGAILIAYLFIDEDDQFDFMGGDAKSPQHTSVHPMYVSYSSIPTSASATILSINHNNNNNNIKKQLIHTNNIDENINQKIFTDNNNKFYNTEDYFDSSNNVKLPSSYTNNSYCNSNNRKPIISSSRASTVSLNTQYQQQNYSPQNQQHNNDAQNNLIKNNRNNYNNFINRPDIKYTQISTEHLLSDRGNNVCALESMATNLDDSNENFHLQTFKNIAIDSGDSISSNTYVPFQKPSPIYPISTANILTGITNNGGNDNNRFIDNNEIINPIRDNSQILVNSFHNNVRLNNHDSQDYFIPIHNNSNSYNPPLPPLPLQPQNSSLIRNDQQSDTNSFISHNQRSGQQPYPDLSPEVTEKYSMPQQYINNYSQQRSPVLSRLSIRRRQDRPHVTNFCDQIRDTPPGYNDVAINIARAKSHDRISNRNNRRHNNNKQRPRSYCNNVNASSKKSKHRQSLYSIEYGSPIDTIRSRDTILDYDDPIDDCNGQLSPKPMTPRRVKRRSVMTRGTNGRQSTASRRSHKNLSSTGAAGGTSQRSSTRSSRRKHHHHLQNPVTKIMEQQQQQIKHHHQQQNNIQISTVKPQFKSFTHIDNPTLTASNLQSLNNEILATTTTNKAAINYKSFTKNISPDPIYYNMSGASTGAAIKSNNNPQQSSPTWNSNNSPIETPPFVGTSSGTSAINNNSNHMQQTYNGHYNPTYQHSTSNLTNNENEHVDDLYNNRPPSVRSSYSNFHGTRPLSSYNPTTSTTENVFVGITGGTVPQQAQSQQFHQHSPHQHNHSHLPSTSSTSSQPQIIPSSRRSASRESIRSMAFLNNGPPAYNLNYHTPPDSETTM